jgi:hypothetical protein
LQCAIQDVIKTLRSRSFYEDAQEATLEDGTMAQSESPDGMIDFLGLESSFANPALSGMMATRELDKVIVKALGQQDDENGV